MSKYFSIKADTEKIRLDIFGDIVADSFWKWGDDDRCPSDISEALKSNPTALVEIHINSGGGDAFAGLAIYNMLVSHKGSKRVYVDGLAASAASVIAMAGDKGDIHIPKTANLMVHRPWTSIFAANEDDLSKCIEMLKSLKESMIAAYMNHAAEGVEESTIREIVDSETWMTGEAATAYFDVQVSDLTAAACTSDLLARYEHTPPALKKPPVPPAAGSNPPPEEHEPPASDAMTVGDELEMMGSFIFTQREEIDHD